MKGVVLCAGLGTRLAPLTDHVPKPLVPVANRPVLELVLERLAAAGIEEVGINLHHKAPMLREFLEARKGCLPRARVVFEPEILDTGGGIAHFRDWTDAGAAHGLLVHNADVVTDLDLGSLVDHHRHHDAEATLALVDHEGTNLVRIDEDGVVRDIRGRLGVSESLGCLRTFSGVYVLSPRFLRRLQPGRRSSVIDALLEAMREQPGCVRGVVQPQETFWRDLGDVPSYLGLHRELLLEGRLGGGGPVRVHEAARIEEGASLEGFVAIGSGCHVGRQVRLTDCVVWPGTRVIGPPGGPAHRLLRDLGGRGMNTATGFHADHSLPGDAPTLEMPCRDFPEPWRFLLSPWCGDEALLFVERIKTGGSSRSFCRVTTRGGVTRSVVVCVTPDRVEYGHYIAAGAIPAQPGAAGAGDPGLL